MYVRWIAFVYQDLHRFLVRGRKYSILGEVGHKRDQGFADLHWGLPPRHRHCQRLQEGCVDVRNARDAVQKDLHGGLLGWLVCEFT